MQRGSSEPETLGRIYSRADNSVNKTPVNNRRAVNREEDPRPPGSYAKPGAGGPLALGLLCQVSPEPQSREHLVMEANQDLVRLLLGERTSGISPIRADLRTITDAAVADMSFLPWFAFMPWLFASVLPERISRPELVLEILTLSSIIGK